MSDNPRACVCTTDRERKNDDDNFFFFFFAFFMWRNRPESPVQKEASPYFGLRHDFLVFFIDKRVSE